MATNTKVAPENHDGSPATTTRRTYKQDPLGRWWKELSSDDSPGILSGPAGQIIILIMLGCILGLARGGFNLQPTAAPSGTAGTGSTATGANGWTITNNDDVIGSYNGSFNTSNDRWNFSFIHIGDNN